MCGIVGVISWSEQHRTSRSTLARMSAAIAHRGPDGEGFYFDRDPDDLSQPITPERPQVAFAFRRLAVLDPTPCSDQPFISTDGRYVLVFNGEIYNFREQREELTRLHPEYVWRSKGDTEVLMQSYAEWGERCVEKFNGMMAFAVWDHRERSLFLARDRMGQKPLYLCHAPTAPSAAIAFASEPAAFAALPWFNNDSVDRTAVRRYLMHGCLDWRSIGSLMCLRPGETSRSVHTSASGPSSGSATYFLPDEGVSYETRLADAEDDAPTYRRRVSVDEIRTAVGWAVERQLVADVPLGVFLSGGIDSSVIATCARRHGAVSTFSIGFDDRRYDESHHAIAVAKHLGTTHHEFRITPNAIEDLPKLAAVFGEPFGDSSALPTHYLARETRRHVTVALSGDGGDELFGGYDRYLAMKLAARIPKWAGPALATFARPFTHGHPKSKIVRLARFASSLSDAPGVRYDRFLRLFDEETIRELMPRTQQVRQDLRQCFKDQLERTQNVVRAALATDRMIYLPDDLLTKVDRCSMLHGLEVRSPFMDHELVELAAQLTEDQLLKGGKKRMLREAFAHELPDFVFKRPKMGFAVPIGEWFRGPLRSFLRDHLFASDSFALAHFKMPVVERLVEEHETERRDHSQRLYALLMLELWWDLQARPKLEELATKDTNEHE